MTDKNIQVVVCCWLVCRWPESQGEGMEGLAASL